MNIQFLVHILFQNINNFKVKLMDVNVNTLLCLSYGFWFVSSCGAERGEAGLTPRGMQETSKLLFLKLLKIQTLQASQQEDTMLTTKQTIKQWC